MSQLGARISIVGAMAFATLFTAVAAFLILVIFKQSLHAYVDAFHQRALPALGISGDRSPALLRWKLVDRPVGEGFALVARAHPGAPLCGTLAVK